MSGKEIQKAGFIAPSTCLPRSAQRTLDRTASLVQKGLGVGEVYFSPFLFSMDGRIDHVTASTEERSRDFKSVIRENNIVISVAGGTGAEDLAIKIDRADYRVIRNRRPVFIGFSDFTFLLSEIYYHSRVPVIYFPSLKLGAGNSRKIFPSSRARRSTIKAGSG